MRISATLIEARLASGRQFGARHHLFGGSSRRSKPPAASPTRCRCSGDAPFVVVNADVFSDFDYRASAPTAWRASQNPTCSRTWFWSPIRRIIRGRLRAARRPRRARRRARYTFSGIAAYRPALFRGASRRVRSAKLAPLLREQIAAQRVSGELLCRALARHRHARSAWPRSSANSPRVSDSGRTARRIICAWHNHAYRTAGCRVHAERRARLARRMQNGIAIIPTAPERARNRDSHYPYRYDSYFYYLTGSTEPDAVLVMIAGEQPRSILFCREKDQEREIWDGFRYGPEAARERFGFDEALSASPSSTSACPSCWPISRSSAAISGRDPAWDARVTGWLNAVRAQVRSGVAAPAAITDVRALLDEMRLIKDARRARDDAPRRGDLDRRASARDAERRAPGMREYEIEAELLHEFRRNGAQAPAYTSIVAARRQRVRAALRRRTTRVLQAGDLLLIDAGCELDGYASDITRTFPGRRPLQRPRSATSTSWCWPRRRRRSARSRPAPPGTRRTTPPCGCWRRASSISACCRAALDAGHRKRRATSSSTCTAPATGWGSTCTTRANTSDRRRLAQARARHGAHGRARLLHPAGDGVPAAFWNIGVRIEDDVARHGGRQRSADRGRAENGRRDRSADAWTERLRDRDRRRRPRRRRAGAGAARKRSPDRFIGSARSRRGAGRRAGDCAVHGSRLILERLGVWSALPQATPILAITVSQQRRFGRVDLTAAQAGLPALGYVVGYAALQRALLGALARQRSRRAERLPGA